jgi:DNA-binding NtrC family response regulator
MKTPDQTETRIILVMARRDEALEAIERQLEKLDMERRRVGSLQEFQQLTHESGAPEVVITGVSLPDGNWSDILRATVRAGMPARVLVCTREADERLWSEAIWRGVHDILVEPFPAEHIRRSLESVGDPPAGNPGQTSSSHAKPQDKDAAYRSIAATAAMAAVA